MSMPPSEPCRILAIDGGGLRGVIPVVILEAFERAIGRPIHECFDVICGTSTGGLIALSLVKPDPMSPSDLVDYYLQQGPKIFHKSPLDFILRLFRAEYSPRQIEASLLQVFGDLCLKEALTNVVVMSYELSARSPWLFKSPRAQGCGNDQISDEQRRLRPPEEYDYLFRDIARATSAAPTFFPPARFEAWVDHVRRPCAFVDGGVFANSPGICGYVEADNIQGLQDRPKVVVSIGTGDAKAQSLARGSSWGLLHWGNPLKGVPILNVMFDGQGKAVERELDFLCGENFFRFNPELGGAPEAMDDVKALPQWERLARQYVASQEFQAKLTECVRILSVPR